ncbi:BppU family phage baseplate upper protein [Clostridium perfringens]|uniref:BppU family phage baseplate upper protein n=1 Tax=Clostridium perfringens TaxID=1502 RepID=UPI003F4260ED
MNNVINKVNKVNTEATGNIGQLTDLNNKAQELSNNIQQALPINTELIKNTELAKVANTNLLATNQEATTKNTELQASLEKTKEFISGLDGSKNPVQMQLDINELKNGLKSNQSLSYEGSSIAANNTLEGRTEGMRIVGRTLNNLIVDGHTKKEIGVSTTSKAQYSYIFRLKENTKYTVIWEIEDKNDDMPYFIEISNFENKGQIKSTSKNKGIGIINTTTGSLSKLTCYYISSQVGGGRIKNVMVLEGDWTNKEIPSFFEGLKSFGEVEKVEDKYKISILSTGKNFIKPPSKNVVIPLSSNSPKVTITTDGSYILDGSSTIGGGRHSFKGLIPTIMLKKRKKYRLSGIDSNDAILWISKVSDNSVLFSNKSDVYTSDEDVEVFFGINYTVTTYNNRLIKPQLEESEVVTQYEQYKEDKKDILIKEPVRKSDYLYEDNGQVKVNRESGQHTFTGNENIILDNSLNTDKTLFFYCPIENVSPKGVYHGYCNTIPFYQTNKRGEIYTNKSEGCFAGDGINKNIQFFIDKSKLTTPNVEGFKAWLKANPTTVVYQLDTPTVEVVDGVIDIDLDTFGEKTYFNILNSLPGTLDFKVPSNIGSVVQNMAKEVNNIWDVINNLLVPSLIDINKNVAMSTIKNNLK